MSRFPTVVITGAAGQDGFFLAKYLRRSRGSRIIGVVSRQPSNARWRPRVKYCDEVREVEIDDAAGMACLIATIRPDLILNFAAVAGSLTQFDAPERLFRVNTISVAAMLDAIRMERLNSVFVQASSSEVFAGGESSPQNLGTLRRPRTIYGVTKIAADNVLEIYRKIYGLRCFSLILFSHESPLRSFEFFTRRVISDAVDILEGRRAKLEIYGPDNVRDWGYAGEYCQRIVTWLNHGRLQDSIVGSGVATTVRDFTQSVFHYLGLNYSDCVEERASQTGRAAEQGVIVADRANAAWPFANPVKYDVNRLVALLVRAEKDARRRIRKDQ